MRLPWFKMYPSDWLMSQTVTMMSFEQRGIYFELMCRAWNEPTCTVPSDMTVLQKLLPGAKKKNIAHVLSVCFTLHGPGLANMRLLSERSAYMLKSEKNRESANIRWNKEKQDANALPTQCESNGNKRQKETQMQTQIKETKEEAGEKDNCVSDLDYLVRQKFRDIGLDKTNLQSEKILQQMLKTKKDTKPPDLGNLVSQKVKDIAIEKAHLAWFSFEPTVTQWATNGERLSLEDPRARTIFNQIGPDVIKNLITSNQKEGLRMQFITEYQKLEITAFAARKTAKA